MNSAKDALSHLKKASKSRVKLPQVIVYEEREDPGLFKRIDAFCKKHGIGRSAFFREAAKLFMAEAEKK